MLITELLSPSPSFCANKANQPLKLIYHIVLPYLPYIHESGLLIILLAVRLEMCISPKMPTFAFSPTLRMCELSLKVMYIEHLDC